MRPSEELEDLTDLVAFYEAKDRETEYVSWTRFAQAKHVTPELYEVSLARGAVKAIATFSASMQVRIWDAMDDLATDPRHRGCKPLIGRDAWRKRVGDYRILYESTMDPRCRRCGGRSPE